MTSEAPLSAREVAQARKEFKIIYDTLVEQGHAYPESASEIVSHAVHGTPTTPLRADAAR